MNAYRKICFSCQNHTFINPFLTDYKMKSPFCKILPGFKRKIHLRWQVKPSEPKSKISRKDIFIFSVSNFESYELSCVYFGLIDFPLLFKIQEDSGMPSIFIFKYEICVQKKSNSHSNLDRNKQKSVPYTYFLMFNLLLEILNYLTPWRTVVHF